MMVSSTKKLTTHELINRYVDRRVIKRKQRNKQLRPQCSEWQRAYRARFRAERIPLNISGSMLISQGEIPILHATQKNELQILPHFRYVYEDGKYDPKYVSMSVEEKHKLVKKEVNKGWNGNNNKQRPRGFGYNGYEFNPCGPTIDEDLYVVTGDCDIVIQNEMEFKKDQELLVRVRHLNINHPIVDQFIVGAQEMGETWENDINNGNRQCIKGTMKHFGIKLGAGNRLHFSYEPTQHGKKNINTYHEKINVAAGVISKHLFPTVFQDIHIGMKKLGKEIPVSIGGRRGLCCELIQSQHALVNESHVDQDMSKCLSIWTVKDRREVDPIGWYLVFPYLTCTIGGKVHRGIAVQLKHGVGIEWDGRSLFHCSTAPINKGINVYGTFFGLMKP